MVNGKVTPPTVKEEEKCGRDRALPSLPLPSLSCFVLTLAIPPRVLYPMCLKCSRRAARSICMIVPFDGACANAVCVATTPPSTTVMQTHTSRLRFIRCSISTSLEGKRGHPSSALGLPRPYAGRSFVSIADCLVRSSNSFADRLDRFLKSTQPLQRHSSAGDGL